MQFDDLLADGQADAGAGVFLGAVQATKHFEDGFKLIGLDADAVVLHA